MTRACPLPHGASFSLDHVRVLQYLRALIQHLRCVFLDWVNPCVSAASAATAQATTQSTFPAALATTQNASPHHTPRQEVEDPSERDGTFPEASKHEYSLWFFVFRVFFEVELKPMVA